MNWRKDYEEWSMAESNILYAELIKMRDAKSADTLHISKHKGALRWQMLNSLAPNIFMKHEIQYFGYALM